MASIRREIRLSAGPDEVWEVVRDVGSVHTRFAPGFVVDTRLEAGARVVTFANGFVARELIVDVDDSRRRLAYSAQSERLSHHNASFQVLEDGGRSCLVWIADLLPEAAAPVIAGMMDEGLKAIGAALGGDSA